MSDRNMLYICGWIERVSFSLLKKTLYTATASLVLLFASFAVAQFEASPDHFDGSAEPVQAAGARQSTELNEQIAAQQARLASYRAAIDAQAAAVDEARQVMMSPALDDAGQVDAFRFEQERLEELRKSLTPGIEQAQLTLIRLQTHLAALTERDRVGRATTGETRVHTAGLQQASEGVPPPVVQHKPTDNPALASAKLP